MAYLGVVKSWSVETHIIALVALFKDLEGKKKVHFPHIPDTVILASHNDSRSGYFYTDLEQIKPIALPLHM